MCYTNYCYYCYSTTPLLRLRYLILYVMLLLLLLVLLLTTTAYYYTYCYY